MYRVPEAEVFLQHHFQHQDIIGQVASLQRIEHYENNIAFSSLLAYARSRTLSENPPDFEILDCYFVFYKHETEEFIEFISQKIIGYQILAIARYLTRMFRSGPEFQRCDMVTRGGIIVQGKLLTFKGTTQMAKDHRDFAIQAYLPLYYIKRR